MSTSALVGPHGEPLHDRLGAVASENDERLAKYPMRALLGGLAPRDKAWRVPLHLDQVGPSCTGHCATFDLAAWPSPVRRPDGRTFTEDDALEAYRQAQLHDEWPGEDYEGSSTDGALRGQLANGFIGGYHWATDIDAVILAVGNVGPVRFASRWTTDMFYPDPLTGVLSPSGGDEGGHSYLLSAVNMRGYATVAPGKLRKVANEPVLRVWNSWWDGKDPAQAWGYRGTGILRRSDAGDLLKSGGEAAIIDLALRRG